MVFAILRAESAPFRRPDGARVVFMQESVTGARRRSARLVVLAALVVLVAGGGAALVTIERSRTDPARPHLVLITADTLRHDHLGYHGAPAGASPVLDRLARRSTRFARLVTASNNTNVSFASLHTGVPMKTHGVEGLAYLGYSLAEEFDTLAETLRGAGYRTVAAVSAPVLDRGATRLDQGFDVYLDCDARFAKQPGEVTSRRALEAVDAILAGGDARRPVFLWVHYFDSHWPYRPPDPIAGLFLDPADADSAASGAGPPEDTKDWVPTAEERRVHTALYAGEVRALDRAIGTLLDGLEARGMLDRSVVVFTADHGENLGERGLFANHQRLYLPVSETSLLVRVPGQETPESVDVAAETTDLYPTCLELLGVPIPELPPSAGVSLVPWMCGRTAPSDRALFSEGAYQKEKSLLAGRYRLTYRLAPFDLSPESFELYDVEADPGEQVDLVGERPEVEGALVAQLLAYMGAPRTSIRVRSRDGDRHVVTGVLRPWKGGVRGAEMRGGEPGEGDLVEAGADGSVALRFEVAREDTDEADVAVDGSSMLGAFFEVDGRPATLDEIWFPEFPRSETALRLVVFLDPAAPPLEPTGPPDLPVTVSARDLEDGTWAFRIRLRPSGIPTASSDGHPSSGLEVRLFASSPFDSVESSPPGTVSIRHDGDRLRASARADGDLTFRLPARRLVIVADMRGSGGPLGPREVRLEGGCRVPGGGAHPGVLYSPRLHLTGSAGSGGVLGERPEGGSVRIELTGIRQGRAAAPALDPAVEARLRELGYIGDGNRQN